MVKNVKEGLYAEKKDVKNQKIIGNGADIFSCYRMHHMGSKCL